MVRQKKQFRLYDIYRTVCTGTESEIQGIECYDAIEHDGTFRVTIHFNNPRGEWDGYYPSELNLKDLVKKVNKRLNNCGKPGRKKNEHS